jgi:hypothetical protein
LDSLASGLNGRRVRKIRNMRPAYPTARGLARQFARAGVFASEAKTPGPR